MIQLNGVQLNLCESISFNARLIASHPSAFGAKSKFDYKLCTIKRAILDVVYLNPSSTNQVSVMS